MANETYRYLVINTEDNNDRDWFDTLEDAIKWFKELLVKYEADAAHVYGFKYTLDRCGTPIRKELIF